MPSPLKLTFDMTRLVSSKTQAEAKAKFILLTGGLDSLGYGGDEMFRVGLGLDNTAIAEHNSTSSGSYSYAGGNTAVATHDGSFVRTDSLGDPVLSTADRQATWSFTNGYRFLGGGASFSSISSSGNLTVASNVWTGSNFNTAQTFALGATFSGTLVASSIATFNGAATFNSTASFTNTSTFTGVSNFNNDSTFSRGVGLTLNTLSASAGVLVWAHTNGNLAYHLLTDNVTLSDITNAVPGTYVLILEQDNVGSKTITLDTALFKTPGGGAITLSTAPGSVDVISIVYLGLMGSPATKKFLVTVLKDFK